MPVTRHVAKVIPKIRFAGHFGLADGFLDSKLWPAQNGPKSQKCTHSGAYVQNVGLQLLCMGQGPLKPSMGHFVAPKNSTHSKKYAKTTFSEHFTESVKLSPNLRAFAPKNAGIAFKSDIYVQNCGSKQLSVD